MTELKSVLIYQLPEAGLSWIPIEGPDFLVVAAAGTVIVRNNQVKPIGKGQNLLDEEGDHYVAKRKGPLVAVHRVHDQLEIGTPEELIGEPLDLPSFDSLLDLAEEGLYNSSFEEIGTALVRKTGEIPKWAPPGLLEEIGDKRFVVRDPSDLKVDVWGRTVPNSTLVPYPPSKEDLKYSEEITFEAIREDLRETREKEEGILRRIEAEKKRLEEVGKLLDFLENVCETLELEVDDDRGNK